VSVADFSEYFSSRISRIPAQQFLISHDSRISLATYVVSVYENDEEFRHFLDTHRITSEHLRLAGAWVTRLEQTRRKAERWWSRDALGRFPSLGKDWAYGKTFLLDRFGYDLERDYVWHMAGARIRPEDDEVEDMEHILARDRQANALLVGDDPSLMRMRVAQLYRKIKTGEALSPLEGKAVHLLDIEQVVSETGEKSAFETLCAEVFTQAVLAGNVIIYIEHFGSSLTGARAIGSDLVQILTPFAEAHSIQIIVGCDERHFEAFVAHDARMMRLFDVVRMRGVAQEGALDLLEQRADTLERQSGVVFSVPALLRILDLADRYFPTGVMPDKALDLLEEIFPEAQAQNQSFIGADFVDACVHHKTKAPVGEPDNEERETLLTLESVLHERIVGQDEAVKVLAHALRRTRAGFSDKKKPTGSFLFLGPTGVGKTETAKALAMSMFHDEHAITRLDMTEFQSEVALEELIGVQGTQVVGRLESLVLKNPFGILLLDEFEKADQTVHDLFLQILDEGHFTNASGKEVSLRNYIIIATSNAGAEALWHALEEGKGMPDKSSFLSVLLGERIFRPELLNRFDDIVLFHPLSKEQVRAIATLRLKELQRLLAKEHGITLVITDELVEALVEKGYDPRMGGRPLARALKEHIQQPLADKMLRGEIHSGDTVSLSREEVLRG
jgi:ATP-dependent Clp protease ATP-binding subunit ClpC